MVHVAMRDADDITGQGKVWTPANIKTDIQLRHLDDCLFSCHAIANNVKLTDGDPGKLLHQERLAFALHEARRIVCLFDHNLGSLAGNCFRSTVRNVLS